MKCEDCKFYVGLVSHGECHAHPPDKEGEWAVTNPGWWCGEFVDRQAAEISVRPAVTRARAIEILKNERDLNEVFGKYRRAGTEVNFNPEVEAILTAVAEERMACAVLVKDLRKQL